MKLKGRGGNHHELDILIFFSKNPMLTGWGNRQNQEKERRFQLIVKQLNAGYAKLKTEYVQTMEVTFQIQRRRVIEEM